jgi:hypothetical protein
MRRLIKTRLTEANHAEKILKDPRMTKMLALAVKHDSTFPAPALASLGPKPSDEDVVKLWSKLIDRTLALTNYGDLSRDGKFDAWLTKLYVNHINNYEEINGEGGDALGSWKALSVRGLLDPNDQDFNKFSSIEKLQKVIRKDKYRDALRKIADAEKLAAMKKNAKQIVLIDNDRYYVIVPLNYGSCYTFNNAEGHQGQFCTGSSSGLNWFNRYSSDGPIVSIIDKQNMNNKNGKWQMHSATRQLKNATQDYNVGEEQFTKLFPGLMKHIVSELESRSEELKNASIDMGISRGGWNIPEEVARIKRLYPTAYHSEDVASDEEMNHLFGRDRG